MHSSSGEMEGLFQNRSVSGPSEQSLIEQWLGVRIGLPLAATFFIIYAGLVYWPVLIGHRFFWEDFFIQEYPIREYCYYMFGLHHELPFWNPYSWSWAPLLADAQSGLWYPTNLVEIATAKLLTPSAAHLSVLIPEVATLIHLPIAALGVYQLCRKRFATSDFAALLAGLAFGFGIRMVAEQNHSMQIIQLALLPWETLLLMGAWKDLRQAVGLGLLFGISFLAGQPQTYFFISIFLGCFTIAETITQEGSGFRRLIPLRNYTLALVLSIGVAAIQLLPTLGLTAMSARAHLNYADATTGAINYGHLLNFFVPKAFGENPGFNFSYNDIIVDTFNYWEATFYWGMLPEILAAFAVAALWKRRSKNDPASRYLLFAIIFSSCAVAYGLGHHLHFQWFFWRFLPIFNQLRGPNRMIWFAWFLGSVYTAIGLDIFLRSLPRLIDYRKFLTVVISLFVGLNLLTALGAFDLIFNKSHRVRSGLFVFTLPSLAISATVGLLLIAFLHRKIPIRLALAAILFVSMADLYYFDSTWHRNTVNPEQIVANDGSSEVISDFKAQHQFDHTKFLRLMPDAVARMRDNLGMFLRLPIEDRQDSAGVKSISPMRLARIFPPVLDSTLRMKMMGVIERTSSAGLQHFPDAIPFVKLYKQWLVAPTDSLAAKIYLDSAFDFHRTIVLESNPVTPETSISGTSIPNTSSTNTALLTKFDENSLSIDVSAAEPSVLLIDDLFYPAWKATQDGQPAVIQRGFTSLRAIPVSAGHHHILLYYDDPRFDIGWKISLAAILACLGFLIFTKHRPTSPLSPVSS